MNHVSTASHPGRFALSDARLARLQPELVAGAAPLRRLAWRAAGLFAPGFSLDETKRRIAEHLRNGDARAAVVASVRPLRVAAYSDEFDAVALLAFPNPLADELGLRAGDRLVTVNNYERSAVPQRDVVSGPAATGRFTGFWPLIADFLTDDARGLAERKAGISEDEWRRCRDLADVSIRAGAAARDGRPRYARYHAGGFREGAVAFMVVAVVVAAVIAGVLWFSP